MAMTRSESASGKAKVERWVETGADDTILTASTTTTPNLLRRLILVTCKYDDTATQAGVTVTLNSGAGAAYDTILLTGTANAEDNVFIPDNPLYLMKGDTIDVVAPAGGAGVAAAVAVYFEI